MSRDAEMATAGYPKSPYDWYVEPRWCVDALIAAEGFDSGDFVYDPACGLGTIPDAFEAAGINNWRSDIAPRAGLNRTKTGQGPLQVFDFLSDKPIQFPLITGRLSIICNPPFSYEKDIAERFVRRALAIAEDRVCMLLPLKWQASARRHQLFEEHRPNRIWVLSERPSMPPGAKVEELGNKAFKRGKVDYMWMVWEGDDCPPVTEWRTIAPRPKAARA